MELCLRRIFAIIIGILILNGCAAPGGNSKTEAAQANKLTIDDLDQLTYVYADRYMTLISSACDQIARDNTNPQQRLLASQVKRINCSSIYDIATSRCVFAGAGHDPGGDTAGAGVD